MVLTAVMAQLVASVECYLLLAEAAAVETKVAQAEVLVACSHL